ncbi:hypothetical protein [Isoalcanivorax indicus]|uniref:hypothetical protein n=1 Tax=Isoalcanivorax indicus TaxID=2202653 RepID=UPI0013C52094|nr:hypothetical protein [Isoalcanivorax indicus]
MMLLIGLMLTAPALPSPGSPQTLSSVSEPRWPGPLLALVGDTNGLSFSERARRRQLEIEREGLQRDLARGRMSAAVRQRKQQRLREIELTLQRLGG